MKGTLNKLLSLSLSLLLIISLLTGCFNGADTQDGTPSVITLSEIPAFDGKTPYVEINGNEPSFTEDEITDKSFESYSELDSLGRCGVAISSVGKDLMPTEDRGSISNIIPSGWVNARYDIVDGTYLYNRCHLIGFQLTGENANKENLITGTRFMNVEGMLPFENMIADYVKETENHVMYRVSPIFDGDNLVASGVLLEAYSVEDEGDGISFSVYVYNNQPGIVINYATGESRLETDSEKPESPDEPAEGEDTGFYILNTDTKKFHLDTCGFADDIREDNREEVFSDREILIEDGYTPCKSCDP